MSKSIFRPHKLNPSGKANVEGVRVVFENFLEHIELYCPEGRELALVRTKLQEASFFAVRAVAADPANHMEVNQ